MKKKIIVTARQMSLLLIIYKGFGFHPMVENTLDQVRITYPEGIPIGCDAMFSLEIPVKQIATFFNTLSKAEHHQAFKNDEYCEEITTLKFDLKYLFNQAGKEQYIFQFIVLLGNIVLAPKIIKQLAARGIEVIRFYNLDDVENLVSSKKQPGDYVEFACIMMAFSSEAKFVKRIYRLLDNISETDMLVCQVGGTIPPQLKKTIDIWVPHEAALIDQLKK